MGTVISVGGRYPLPAPAIEGIQVWLEPLTFTIGVPHVTDEEVERFKNTSVKFFLQDLDGLVHVTAKTGVGWMDGFIAFQSAHRAELPEPPEQETAGYGLSLVFVDSRSQIVKAMRLIGLSQEFSRGLYTLWLKHRNDPLIPQPEFVRKTNALMARYPNPKELAIRAPYRYRSGDRI